jgi:hypothetical protein
MPDISFQLIVERLKIFFKSASALMAASPLSQHYALYHSGYQVLQHRKDLTTTTQCYLTTIHFIKAGPGEVPVSI